MPTFSSDQNFLNWFADLSPAEQADPANQTSTISPGRTVYVEVYAGGSLDGQNTGAWGRNTKLERRSRGRWVVSFSQEHPDKNRYHVSLISHEDENNRDAPHIHIVEESIKSSGFEIIILEGDNGSTADSPVDAPWSFGVSAPVELP